MATKKETKPKKRVEKPTDKDNPSLCEIGGEIRLRVLEDFFVEKELPKWKHFDSEWKKLCVQLGSVYNSMSEKEVDEKVERMADKTDEERKELAKRAKTLLAMRKAINDDQWNIQGKHEREVDAAILKNAKFVKNPGMWNRLLSHLPFMKSKAVPVEVAMGDLKDHIELTSTVELTDKLAKLTAIEDGMRKAGQYKKADTVKAYRTILAEEEVVCEKGFPSYVTEKTMIDFIKKSERGTTLDFLRYFEDEIPQEVIAKKIEADKLMVFDNYVVAHYTDVIQKAAKTKKKISASEEENQRKKRRDPILFGIIKNSRKLYYICDWETDTDDLTLEKIEAELGITRSSLVRGAATAGGEYDRVVGDSTGEKQDSVTINSDAVNRMVTNSYNYSDYSNVRRVYEDTRHVEWGDSSPSYDGTL